MGIDISKAKCRAAIMDAGGIILEEFTFTNNHEGIEGLGLANRDLSNKHLS